jgi:hypothetical protein
MVMNGVMEVIGFFTHDRLKPRSNKSNALTGMLEDVINSGVNQSLASNKYSKYGLIFSHYLQLDHF